MTTQASQNSRGGRTGLVKRLAEQLWCCHKNRLRTGATFKSLASSKSAVGFPPVSDGGDLDGVFAFETEEYPVIAAAKAEAGEGRLEPFHVPGAIYQLAVYAVENLNCGFAVDHPQIGARFGQITAMRSGPGCPWITVPVRTRAGCLRAECLHRGPGKRESGRSPVLYPARSLPHPQEPTPTNAPKKPGG